MNHKKYIVFVDYGTEGWQIYHETDDWNEAVWKRENARDNGGNEVIVVEYCEFVVIKKTC
jgi:hypothetical protein